MKSNAVMSMYAAVESLMDKASYALATTKSTESSNRDARTAIRAVTIRFDFLQGLFHENRCNDSGHSVGFDWSGII